MFKQIRTKGQTTIYTENKRSNSTNPTKNWGGGLRCSGRVTVPAPHVTPVKRTSQHATKNIKTSNLTTRTS